MPVAETLVLIVFLLLPALGLTGLWLFFKKFRLHESTRHRVTWLVTGNAIVLLTLILFLLPLGEIYYRWIYDATDSFGLMKTNDRWFERHFHTNESGWRDTVRRYDRRKESGKRRLVILGDSFTAGHGIADVEDTLGLVLRKKLPDWEVRIHSVYGWDSTDEGIELAYLVRDAYEVDAVLLVYCLNDIGPMVPQCRSLLTSINEEKRQAGFLVTNSYLLNLIYYRMYARSHPELAQYFGFLHDAYDGAPWKNQRGILTRMEQSVTDKLKAQLLVCTFPFLDSLGSEYPFSEAHQRLDQLWSELNVPHIDLLPAFDNYRPEELVVSRRDAHPNERAIAIAADKIADFLRANLNPPRQGTVPVNAQQFNQLTEPE